VASSGVVTDEAIIEDMGAGRLLLCVDRLHQSLVLGSELGRCLSGKAVFDLMGVLVDGVAAASGLLGLPGHGAMLTREDGRRVITPARKMRKTPARTASVRLQIRRPSYLPG